MAAMKIWTKDGRCTTCGSGHCWIDQDPDVDDECTFYCVGCTPPWKDVERLPIPAGGPTTTWEEELDALEDRATRREQHEDCEEVPREPLADPDKIAKVWRALCTAIETVCGKRH